MRKLIEAHARGRCRGRLVLVTLAVAAGCGVPEGGIDDRAEVEIGEPPGALDDPHGRGGVRGSWPRGGDEDAPLEDGEPAPPGDGQSPGDDVAGVDDDELAGDDAEVGLGDAEGSGDGDEPTAPADLDQPLGIAPSRYFQADASAAPLQIVGGEQYCVTSAARFTLLGAAGASWRVYSWTALQEQLEAVPVAEPGVLAPIYDGTGSYSGEGQASVHGAELSQYAATIALDVDTDRLLVTNTCAAPLLHVVEYPTGVDDPGARVAAGAAVCPTGAPWTLAISAPPLSSYEVRVFDFSVVAVDSYDETSLPQAADGLIALPPLPTSGRLEFHLLSAAGEEVESVSVYLECP